MSSILGFLKATMAQIHAFALTLGGPGLFFIALADSSFLSIPEANDILIVMLSTGQSWGRMAYYVTMTILGSALGCALLYMVGRQGGAFIERRLKKERVDRIEGMYRRWGIWTIIIPCLLPPPTPFKIFVFSAGFLNLPFKKFIAAIIVGRSVRYYLWGILAVLYGEWAKIFIQENFHTVGTALFVLFAVLLSVYIVIKSRRRSPQQEPA